jgi:alpha-methylacyl-CoA racemase
MGPLEGVRIIELAGLGPAPHCCMLLADMGADVLRIDRTANVGLQGRMPDKYFTLNRGRPNLALDLKQPAGLETALKLCDQADILIEGFRPGVLERLGLGPDLLLTRNEKLVIGRATGWGQTGPISHIAGHDINYISLTGALAAIGPTDGPPVPPLNLVGDFGGGSLYLAMGVLAAYISVAKTGKGQVVDAAMVDGAASLMAPFFGTLAAGRWREDARGSNRIDGGSHFYSVYETKDGKYISVGSIEPQFYALLQEFTGLTGDALYPQLDEDHWPENKARLAAVFRTKTQEEWVDIMQDTDICFAPVLSMSEAMAHPHNQARESFVEADGYGQPAPAPRFSATPGAVRQGAAGAGQHSRQALADWGYSDDEIADLERSGAIKQA